MPRVKTFNEEDVLERAMILFWEKGYYATSMQELVLRTGINRASLYDTFGGKEELFNRVFNRYRESSRVRVIEHLKRFPTVKEGFLQLFENAVDETLADEKKKGCFAVNTASGLLPGDEKMRDVLKENKLQFEEVFYNHLKTGVDSGEIAPEKDLHEMASLIFILYSGIRVTAKMNPDKESMMAAIRKGLEFLD
ncbi:TetR/AcrR family transcriptional regulator [bacterium SCSIO 12741]|nr:TetR/AcrR family transcriptional regulator [bacterium SCSIO 12741]